MILSARDVNAQLAPLFTVQGSWLFAVRPYVVLLWTDHGASALKTREDAYGECVCISLPPGEIEDAQAVLGTSACKDMGRGIDWILI